MWSVAAITTQEPLVAGFVLHVGTEWRARRRGEARAMELLYHQFKRRVFGMAHRIAQAGAEGQPPGQGGGR